MSDSLQKLGFFPTFKIAKKIEKLEAHFLENNIVSYNDSLSNIALYSEIASDFIGPVRVSAGITLAYPKTDTSANVQKALNKKSFLQKFSTGGGTMAINFNLPAYRHQDNTFTFGWDLAPRFSLDPPAFGLSTEKFAHNTSLGTEFQSSLQGIKGVFRFTGAARFSYITGNSAFYEALELTGADRKAFFLNNFTLGLVVKDKFSLSYTKFFGGDALTKRLKGNITFTVSPNFDKL
ncbi:MAG: hypothetical protein V4594_08385 [Bacteroidota bacterium]